MRSAIPRFELFKYVRCIDIVDDDYQALGLERLSVRVVFGALFVYEWLKFANQSDTALSRRAAAERAISGR